MKFALVDQLLAITPGKSITMAKNVSMAEEYLQDHFPGFPVLPGVMMLEAAIQTSAWLVRATLGYDYSLIVLKEARGVRYGNFVAPGNTLMMQADAVKIEATRSDFKIKGTLGTVDGPTAIQARIELVHLKLVDTDPAMASADERLRTSLKEQWEVLTRK